MYHIYALSDSTGRTVDQAARVVLAQFPQIESEVHLFAEVDSFEEIDSIIKLAHTNSGLIIHSFVKHELSEHLWYEGRLHNLEVINLLGPILNRFSNFLHSTPEEKPGLFSRLNKDYFRRIETTEYALKHDDGAHLEGLVDAEIVLLGVSRTFKTPISIYLAFKGWLVANVPVVLNMPIPDIVYKLPPEKVFCLTTNPEILSRLRNVRNEYLKGNAPKYASYDYVKKEINYASMLFNVQSKWTKVRVTAKPIEEIANNIINIYRRNTKPVIS
ncbi:MAG: kinase/pyrophosphorylase [Bacteroidetes bacterium]|nr:kinase/pyrophosphorylase [Bacteroidota bacterium]